jgi:hypothetical protein
MFRMESRILNRPHCRFMELTVPNCQCAAGAARCSHVPQAPSQNSLVSLEDGEPHKFTTVKTEHAEILTSDY